MKKELLADNMIVYIGKKIAGNFIIEMIMDEFYSMRNHRQTWFDMNVLFYMSTWTRQFFMFINLQEYDDIWKLIILYSIDPWIIFRYFYYSLGPKLFLATPLPVTTTTTYPQKPINHNPLSTFNTKPTNLYPDPRQNQTHQHSTFHTVNHHHSTANPNPWQTQGEPTTTTISIHPKKNPIAKKRKKKKNQTKLEREAS